MPTEEYKKRKLAYISSYQKKNYKHISFKVRCKEDMDIIEYLNTVPNKSELIKQLIRTKMGE